jgi:hypothetical protein
MRLSRPPEVALDLVGAEAIRSRILAAPLEAGVGVTGTGTTTAPSPRPIGAPARSDPEVDAEALS